MDIVGHALYGATVCSRCGFAGGRKGTLGVSWVADWTVWMAIGFSLLPDLASIGFSVARIMLGDGSHSFHEISPHVMALYRFTHNLVVAGLVVGLCGVIRRPLAMPAVAWPVHILWDSVLHGPGRWEVPMFSPLTQWHYHGIDWWRHSDVVLAYWGALPIIWLLLHLWRRGARNRVGAIQAGRPRGD